MTCNNERGTLSKVFGAVVGVLLFASVAHAADENLAGFADDITGFRDIPFGSLEPELWPRFERPNCWTVSNGQRLCEVSTREKDIGVRVVFRFEGVPGKQRLKDVLMWFAREHRDSMQEALADRYGQPSMMGTDGSVIWARGPGVVLLMPLRETDIEGRVFFSTRAELDAGARAASGAAAPTDTAAFSSIRAKCAERWPDDYEMRLYCEDKQLEALRKLRAR
jgi:hypothetical protein